MIDELRAGLDRLNQAMYGEAKGQSWPDAEAAKLLRYAADRIDMLTADGDRACQEAKRLRDALCRLTQEVSSLNVGGRGRESCSTLLREAGQAAAVAAKALEPGDALLPASPELPRTCAAHFRATVQWWDERQTECPFCAALKAQCPGG